MSRLEVAALTDPGRQREQNEDCVDYSLAADDPSAGLFVVADGMGGYAAGEVASATAVQRIMGVFGALREGSLVDRLRQAVEAGNLEVYRAAQEPERRGMGSTVVCAAIEQGRLVSAHVGDSRLYRLRGAAIARLTRDHSLVQVRVDSGLMTLEEAEAAGNRNIITRALGLQPEVEVEVGEHPLRPGDCFLLCTDGLCGQIRDPEIRDILATAGPAEACRRFVDLANQRGGPDNITALIVAVPGTDGAADANGNASPTQEMTLPAATTQEMPRPIVDDQEAPDGAEADGIEGPAAPSDSSVSAVPGPDATPASAPVGEAVAAAADGAAVAVEAAAATESAPAVRREDAGPLTRYISLAAPPAPPEPVVASAPPAPPKRSGRRPWAIIVGAVVLVLCIAAVLIYLNVRTASPASAPKAAPTAAATVAPPPAATATIASAPAPATAIPSRIP